MAQITYADKVAINENPNVNAINKIRDEDMNEIKSVVNENDTNVGSLSNLNTTDKTSIVNAINETISYNTWKTLSTNVSPSTNVNLPSSYNEIQVEINVNTSSTATTNFITLILSKAQIDTITGSNYKNFRTGASYSSSFYFGVTVRAYATYITLTEVYNSGSLVNDYSTMNVYYR